MAKHIIWSPQAEIDLTQILEYYFFLVEARDYARKLNSIFEKEIELISKFPLIGKSTNREKIRVKIVGHYYIIYENSTDFIFVLRLWDSRQDPLKLNIELK